MATMMQFLLPATLALTLATAPNPAGATPPPNIQEYEWAMVPAWCPEAGAGVSVTGNAAQYQAGLAKIKDPEVRAKIASLDRSGCSGVDHYCNGLILINRANLNLSKKEDSQNDKFLTAAIADFEFIAEHASKPSCSLLPDTFTKLGEIQMQLNNPIEAEINFKKALTVQPGYPQAFIGLSDLFESQGQTDKSIAVLREGLKVSPQSSALKKKLARIEGRTAASENPK